VYVVSAWKQVGVEAEHKLEESATWSKSRLTRDFELLVDLFGFAAEGDPDEIMVKFTPSSPSNWGRFKDPVVDQLFAQQKVERDAQKRARLVQDMQKRIMDKAWEIVGLGWTRTEVRSSGCTTMPRSPATG
jgi:ABC-type transport system substrate-binding protein